MRRALAVVALIAAAAACRRAAPASPIASVVDPYLRIHAELVRDHVNGVQGDADAVAAAAAALPQAQPIVTTARALATTTTIADARDKFGALSDAIVAYVNTTRRTPPAGVRVAYCPMAKRPWLQRGTTIANPYYGSRMPTCGELR